MIVDEDGTLWFRQSWMETAHICAERGRLAIVEPEFDDPINDAALIGTASHHGIAVALRGGITTEDDCAGASYENALQLCKEQTVKWTKWSLPTQLADHAARCAGAWWRDIRPLVPEGGLVEHEFAVELFEMNLKNPKTGETQTRKIGIKGIIDYAVDGLLFDWKTASKKYEQRPKQRTAIQPTVYAMAAMHGALGEMPYRYPVEFVFGVMVRGDVAATTQMVTVQRTHNHELWLLDQMRTYVNLINAMGVWIPWPRNDESYLCNSTWCPWHSICKGARLTDAEDTWRG